MPLKLALEFLKIHCNLNLLSKINLSERAWRNAKMAEAMQDYDINASILGEEATSTHHEGLLLEHDEPMMQPSKKKISVPFLGAAVITVAILAGGAYYLTQGHTKANEKPNVLVPKAYEQTKPSPALSVPSGPPEAPAALTITQQAANPVQITAQQPPSMPPVISQPNPVAQQAAAAISQTQVAPHKPLAPVAEENNSAMVKRVATIEEDMASIKAQMLAISKKIDQITTQAKEVETKPVPVEKHALPKPAPKMAEAKKPEQPVNQVQTPIAKAPQSQNRPQQQIMVSSPAKPVSVSQPLPLEVMPRSQSGIAKLSTDGVTVQGGGFVKIGDEMADGSRLVKVDPAAGIVVTDKRILKIVQ